MGDDLGFFLKKPKPSYHEEGYNKTLLASKKFFLIKEASNLFANAKYLTTSIESLNDEDLVENEESNYLKTSNLLRSNNELSIFKIDPKIKVYLIDRYYSIIQTNLRVFVIATHSNADLILRAASSNSLYTCVTVIAVNSELLELTLNSNISNRSSSDREQASFLFKSCILNSTVLNCLLKLRLNLNSHFISLNKKILIYYKIESYANVNECYEANAIHQNDFILKRYKYKFIESAKFIPLNDYNRKFSKQILFTPYLPFNVYIPKSEYRFENKLFISCEFLNDYLNTQYIFEHLKKFSLK